MDVARHRVWFGRIGIVALAVTFLGMIGAAVVSPSFSVTRNALSNLGTTTDSAGTGTTVLLFNGGLILGGIGGVVLGVGLAATVDGIVTRLGAVLYAVSLASMAGVGLFPQTHPYHFPVAAGFYVLFSLAVIVYGIGCLLRSDGRGAALSVAAGVANLAVWVGWGVTGSVTRDGLAVPELLGALAVGLWTLWAARGLLDTESAAPTRASPMEFGQ